MPGLHEGFTSTVRGAGRTVRAGGWGRPVRPHLTHHGEERMGERLGLSASASERLARRAWERGLKHGDTSGRLHRYLDGLFLAHRQATNLRVYGEHAYLFGSDEQLITVLLLPRELREAARR